MDEPEQGGRIQVRRTDYHNISTFAVLELLYLALHGSAQPVRPVLPGTAGNG